MFGKKKTEAMNGRRNRTVIRETLERIVIRTRGATQIAFCTSCGKLTRCLTPEQAQEIFGQSRVSAVDAELIENVHLLKAGEATLLCASSMANDEQLNEKEK